MGWSKRQIIEEAYAELALAGYTFDRTPAEDLRAVRRLDAMLAFWDKRGISLGYALSDEPDLELDSGIPLHALEPVFLNLAVRLAPGEGKSAMAATVARAAEGYQMLMTDAAQPIRQQMPAMLPRGAGYKAPNSPFTPAPVFPPIEVGDGGDLEFLE